MAYSIQVPTSASLSAQQAVAAPARLLRSGVETLLRWQRRASERHQLGSLNEYDLRDMGLSRGDALMEADKPFWRS